MSKEKDTPYQQGRIEAEKEISRCLTQNLKDSFFQFQEEKALTKNQQMILPFLWQKWVSYFELMFSGTSIQDRFLAIQGRSLGHVAPSEEEQNNFTKGWNSRLDEYNKIVSSTLDREICTPWAAFYTDENVFPIDEFENLDADIRNKLGELIALQITVRIDRPTGPSRVNKIRGRMQKRKL